MRRRRLRRGESSRLSRTDSLGAEVGGLATTQLPTLDTLVDHLGR